MNNLIFDFVGYSEFNNLFQMAYELHSMLICSVSLMTGERVMPAYGGGSESFLNNVITPIYDVIREVPFLVQKNTFQLWKMLDSYKCAQKVVHKMRFHLMIWWKEAPHVCHRVHLLSSFNYEVTSHYVYTFCACFLVSLALLFNYTLFSI